MVCWMNMMLVTNTGTWSNYDRRNHLSGRHFLCGFNSQFMWWFEIQMSALHIQLLKMVKDHRYFQFAKWIKEEKHFKAFSSAHFSRCWQRVVCSETSEYIRYFSPISLIRALFFPYLSLSQCLSLPFIHSVDAIHRCMVT